MKIPSLRLISIVAFTAARACFAQAPQAPAAAPAPVPAPEKAPFLEDFGDSVAGTVIPDFEVWTDSGATAHLSTYIAGKPAIVVFVKGDTGLGDAAVAYVNALAKRYSDQGLTVVGLAHYVGKAEFTAWAAANKAKYNFPIVSDTAGAVPKPQKPLKEMTPADRKVFAGVQWAVMSQTIMVKLLKIHNTVPLPTFLVLDKDSKVVGWTPTFRAVTPLAMGNLLTRAGLKLVPEDKPSKLYTHEETQIHKPGVFLTAGTAAPDFVTMDINHKPVKLSDFRGKVLVLDFWATWCGPCQASMPHTQEVSEKYKDQGVVVLGVCTEDKRDKYEAWVQKNQSKYPGILFTHDPATKASEYASSKVFGVPGIPTQFVIGADGTIVSTVVGYLKGEVILEGALAKAGIKVDPALVAKAAEDLKNR